MLVGKSSPRYWVARGVCSRTKYRRSLKVVPSPSAAERAGQELGTVARAGSAATSATQKREELPLDVTAGGLTIHFVTLHTARRPRCAEHLHDRRLEKAAAGGGEGVAFR